MSKVLQISKAQMGQMLSSSISVTYILNLFVQISESPAKLQLTRLFV